MLEDPGSWLTCRAPSAPTRTTHAWSAALTRAFVVDKADKSAFEADSAPTAEETAAVSAFEADSAATEVDTVAVDSVRIPTDVDVADSSAVARVSRSVARVSREVIATTGMRKATVLYEAILLMKEKFVSPNMTVDQIEIDHLTQD